MNSEDQISRIIGQILNILLINRTYPTTIGITLGIGLYGFKPLIDKLLPGMGINEIDWYGWVGICVVLINIISLPFLNIPQKYKDALKLIDKYSKDGVYSEIEAKLEYRKIVNECIKETINQETIQEEAESD